MIEKKMNEGKIGREIYNGSLRICFILFLMLIKIPILNAEEANLQRVKIDELSETLLIEGGEYDLFTRIKDDVVILTLQQKEKFCQGFEEGKTKLAQNNYEIVLDKNTNQVKDFTYRCELIARK